MFDPSKPFKKVKEFDSDKPFDKMGFNPKVNFQVLPDPKQIREMVEKEISKIKPRTIERVIEPIYIQPKESPPQIIKEVRVEVEKKDPRKYVELSIYQDLLIRLNKLETKLKETTRMAEFPIVVGGPGVIGIPPPEPNPDGYLLTVEKGKAKWKASSSSGSSDVYTPTNVVTNRGYNATSTSIDELANVLGSLIASLQGAGIVK